MYRNNYEVGTLKFLTIGLFFMSLVLLISFWAIWYWPLLTVMMGFYTGYHLLMMVNHVNFSLLGAISLLLIVLIFLGATQIVISILLITLEEDVDDAKRLFQYFALVKGAIMIVLCATLRISLNRFYYQATRPAVPMQSDLQPVLYQPTETMDYYEGQNHAPDYIASQQHFVPNYVMPRQQQYASDYRESPQQQYVPAYNQLSYPPQVICSQTSPYRQRVPIDHGDGIYLPDDHLSRSVPRNQNMTYYSQSPYPRAPY